MSYSSSMVKKWSRLCTHYGIAENTCHPLFHELAVLYSAPSRKYHTLRHVEECLDMLAGLEHESSDAGATAFALWYHDAVYDTRAKDNEEQSALLAHSRLAGLTLPHLTLNRVGDLIRATSHAALPADPDGRLIADIDLSILGKSTERYEEYRDGIREEYGWVEQSAFTAGRSAVLRQFLERPSIYATLYFQQNYEEQARSNITRELLLLSAS